VFFGLYVGQNYVAIRRAQGCILTPCENGGVCVNDGIGRSVCDCLNGFTGSHCQVPVGFAPLPPSASSCDCLNGGSCVNSVGSPSHCRCTKGHYGLKCEKGFPAGFISGSHNDNIRGIAADTAGNVYIAGDTTSLQMAASDSSSSSSAVRLANPNYNLQANAPSQQVFVAKYGYQNNFTLDWVKMYGTHGEEACVGLVVSPANGIFVLGTIRAPQQFASIFSFYNDPLNAVNSWDPFILNLNTADGSLLQTPKLFTYAGSQLATSIAIAPSLGLIAVSGSNDGGVYYSPSDSPAGSTAFAAGMSNTDTFLLVVHFNMTVFFFKSFGSNQIDNPAALSFDSTGNQFVLFSMSRSLLLLFSFFALILVLLSFLPLFSLSLFSAN
jgi:hypothetical protein